ncbi:Rieske 2Fe-2S domain-containing protein [Streptomyces halobius]|uniref:Rieske 2Fe-2S domain-containing protein n=1 Tax=Streptomyces halobius TaxID=2879846 RepID=A0ABY4MHI4_9ACTN|nr:Rieske 2Fe-2S domain-containing protein [Streptomyces halobius]UQA97265.1 Rieske 2Fe-2S domain-containing protein [Streptomyces halobius]
MTFSVAGRNNCAVVAGEPYVYARTDEGAFVMRARCPHRGGPLHLATLAPERNRLVCPWHERKTSLTRLRQEIPAVRSGDTVTAVFPGTPDATVGFGHRPLSVDLAG